MAGRLIPLADKSGPLKKEDVTCPICWSILIEPVTLPCKHILCLDCFKKHVEETSLQCPCCRMRLSVWSRRAFRENNLVDKKLWERIKKEFPKLVDARLCGEDSQSLMPEDLLSVDDRNKTQNLLGEPYSLIDEFEETPRTFDGEISTNKGEIKRELEDLIRKHQEDIENQRRIEERASADLIRQLKEAGELQEIVDPAVVEADLQLARKLDDEQKKVRLAEITSKRKLFTEPGSSGCQSLPLESPRTRGKLISEWTTPNTATSTSTTHLSSNRNCSSNIDKCATETPKNNRGKRPSLSTLSSRSKKLKKGNVSSSKSIRNPFTSQKANSQTSSPSSQNSILDYLSNSQKSLNDSSSQSLLPGSPEPCSSASVRSEEKFFNPFNSNYSCKNPHAPATATSHDSDADITSSFSAFSPMKCAQSKLVPGAVYQTNSVVNPWSHWIAGEKSQLSEDPFNDISDKLSKSCERDTPTPNSIDLEISSHFRPIRSAPKTPPKVLPNGKISNPIIVKTTPRKLNPIVIQVTSETSINHVLNSTSSTDAKPNKIPSVAENGKRISDDSGRASVSSVGSNSIETLSDSDSSGCVTKAENDNDTPTNLTDENICKSFLNSKLKDDVTGRISPQIPTLTPIQVRPRPASVSRSQVSSVSSSSPPLPDISMYGPCSSPSISSVNAATAAGETDTIKQEKVESNSQDDPTDLNWLRNINAYEPGSPSSQISSIIDLDDRRRQVEEFERLRLRKLQEEEDRKFAEKLQKQMNKGSTTRENPYGLRSWLRNSSSSNPNTPS